MCLVVLKNDKQKTHASHRMIDDVSDDVKRRRHEESINTFRQCAKEVNTAQIGQHQTILIEQVCTICHCFADCSVFVVWYSIHLQDDPEFMR